jgi:microcystin-dependent protein
MPATGKVIIGAGGTLKVGATIGADSVTLTEAQMPAHKHTITDPGHAHGPNGASFVIGGGNPSPANIRADSGSYGVTGTTAAATTGISIDSTGGSKAFDNRQASLALLYCKKD